MFPAFHQDLVHTGSTSARPGSVSQ